MVAALHTEALALDDLLTCSTCLEVMCDPVTVSPCGHSYCCACLQRWMEQSIRCPLCSVPMRHVALSFTLKAVAQRLHGPALAVRRQRLGIEERHAFSVEVAPAPALPVIGPLWMRTLEVWRAHGLPANLTWRHFAAMWFVCFAAVFVVIQFTIASQLGHLAHDPVALQAQTLELIGQHLFDLPMHLVYMFVVCFCGFFTLFMTIHILRQRGAI